MKANLKSNLSWLLLMVVGFVLINFLVVIGVIDSFTENMLVTIGINIILAVGLNLVIGFSGQFSLGHAGFMAIGAYATGIMTLGGFDSFGGWIVSVLVGMAIAAVVAIIVGIPCFRLSGDYLAIATMGAAEIVRIVLNNMKITQYTTWPLVYVLTCLTTIVTVNFIHSRGGRAVMSVRDNEIAAEAMGINTTRWKLAAFVLGAVTAAIAGSLSASYIQTIAPSNYGIMQSVSILIIVVLGGMGSMTGTFVAAVVLGILDTVLQSFGVLRMVIYAIVLILMMVFKPSGLMGTNELSFARIFNHKKADKGEAKA